jgi:hypothetical protein
MSKINTQATRTNAARGEKPTKAVAKKSPTTSSSRITNTKRSSNSRISDISFLNHKDKVRFYQLQQLHLL